LNEELIAPCGMNCAICSRYLATKHDSKHAGIRIPHCSGCRPRDKRCAFLKKRCSLLLNREVSYCYECREFPCEKLLNIDKRYQTFFHMSMIDNLNYIKVNGINQFLDKEKTKWRCPECGDIICCHNGICFNCGTGKLKSKNKLFRWEDERQTEH
jgi:hypothetical protein